MSDELLPDGPLPDESTPDELRLPEELAAFEAKLAAKPLAAAGIDRDKLMYRAGWASCESQALQPRPLAGGRLEAPDGLSAPPAEPGAAVGQRRVVAWSGVSAALAASIAVVAMLEWRDAQMRREVDEAGGGTPQLAAIEGVTSTEIQETDERPARSGFALNDVDRLLKSNGRRDGVVLAGPWFAMQQRQFSTASSERVEEVAITGDAPAVIPKTARELWDELVPREPAAASLWPWQRSSTGESI